MKLLFTFLVALLTSTSPFAQTQYACFKSDANKKVQLTVCFQKKKALYVKYRGQKKIIRLIYSSTKQTDNGGGTPSFFWKETYLVKTGKTITGTYEFTNGGAYELQLTYINKKTKSKTNFTIIENLAGDNFMPYRDTPCF